LSWEQVQTVQKEEFDPILKIVSLIVIRFLRSFSQRAEIKLLKKEADKEGRRNRRKKKR